MASVLLVDDDPNILDGLKDILEDAGHDVAAASTGAQARALCASAAPALILIDFNLPDETGAVLAASLRILRPQARIYLMTGFSQDDLRGGAAGVDGVLTKPVPVAQLLSLAQG